MLEYIYKIAFEYALLMGVFFDTFREDDFV